MRIAICDDEEVFHNELYNMLESYFSERRISFNSTHFYCGKQLLKSDIHFDIIFMDYKMEDIDGLETSRILRQKNRDTKIIFISYYPEIVFDSFLVDTFRFIIKPVIRKNLYEALDSYRSSLDQTKYLIINTKEEVFKIEYHDVIYLEAKSKHTLIRTPQQVLECKSLFSIFSK